MNYSTFDTMKVSADRSAPVQWRLRSKSPEIGAVIDHLVGQIRLIKGYKKPPPVKGLRAAAELLVLNFLRCRYSDHNRLLGIPLNSGAGLYKCGRVSYTNMMLAVRGMTTLQLLTVAYGGYRDREAGRGRQTRFQGAPELFALCAAFGATPNMVLSRERDPLVELRGEKPKDGSRAKVYERWPSGSITARDRMKANLRTINAALESSFIGLHVTDKDLNQMHEQLAGEASRPRSRRRDNDLPSHIDLANRTLYRIFNDGSAELGGRFYGPWWMAVPKQYRKYIHIARPGNPYPTYTFERDYRAVQPAILYAEAGIECPGDPYKIYGSSTSDSVRGIVKTVLLPMLNAANRTAALRASNNAVKDRFQGRYEAAHPGLPAPNTNVTAILSSADCPPMKTLFKDIESFHEPIFDRFYSPNVGKHLQFQDSKLAEMVMLWMIRMSGTVVLPIHDSFVCRKGYEDELEAAMQTAFRALFHTEINIKLEESERDEERSRNPPDGNIDLVNLIDPSYLDSLRESPPSEYVMYDAMVSDWEAGINGRIVARKASRKTLSDKVA
jgi:hypothetical protein